MDLLKDIANANENTEENSLIGFNAFGDFALGICFIYYIKPGADIFGTQTDINLAILERFATEKLEFAFPTQTLYNINQPAN